MEGVFSQIKSKEVGERRKIEILECTSQTTTLKV